MIEGAITTSCLAIKGNQGERVERVVVEEAALRITVNGSELVTLMCSPVALEDLVLGFLLNEGIAHSPDQIAHLGICDDGSQANVRLVSPEIPRIEHTIRTSGCGGGVAFDDVADQPPPSFPSLSVSSSQLVQRMQDMLSADPLGTGGRGLHTSALSDGQSLTVITQDVGRHNTIDRIRGQCAGRSIPSSGGILLTSGRISSDMLSKCARMEVPIVVSRTSSTSLSLQLAEKWGMTLVGYLRGQRMEVYTHPERIVLR